MKRINFSIQISASRERVWNSLWEDKNYREWTRAFSEGSHVVSDWKEGSKILFLDGNGSGMVSKIAEKRSPEFISFNHLGEVKNGVEDLQSASAQGWAGSQENYTLTEKDGKTELLIEVDTLEKYEEMFSAMWPKALEALRKIAESK